MPPIEQIEPREIKPIASNTYEVELLGHDKVEIGDKNSVDFKPHIKLNRWDGECFIAIQPAGEIEEEVEYEVEGDKVKCKYKVKYEDDTEEEFEAEFYPLEPTTVIAKNKDGIDHEFKQNDLGGFEFEVILKKKPKTNKIVLNIETQGLKFYYQPELTPEEIAEGSFRPDNVVGSYAVYHATRTNMHRGKVDAEKYKCGKAFHIYRPKIADAEGKWIWGQLSLDEQAGTLTTIIPQEFLDRAVYPVSVDPNFGYETKGGTSYLYILYMRTLALTFPDAGTVTSLTGYIFSQTEGANWAFGLYTGVLDPDSITRVDYSAEGSGTFDNWSTLAAQVGYSLGGEAGHLVIHCTDEETNTVGYYDAGATNEMASTSSTVYSYPLPTTYTCTNNYDRKLSIYCTYTEVGAPTFIPTVMII